MVQARSKPFRVPVYMPRRPFLVLDMLGPFQAVLSAAAACFKLKGLLQLVMLSTLRASAQVCETEVASLTGTEFGSEFTFDCADDAYISRIDVAGTSDSEGFIGFTATCSDNVESEVFGVFLFQDSIYQAVDCTGGLTEMYTTPGVDDNEYPAHGHFFCYNDDNPSGAKLGPYP